MTVTSHEVPQGAYGVAIGVDGAVWSTLPHADALVRLDADGGWGLVPLEVGNRPTVMASGPEGDVWFARSDGAIGSDEADRTVTTFRLRGDGGGYGICVAPDGSVWSTDPAEDRVRCLRSERWVDRIDIPRGSMPSLITTGPDETIWCTLNQLHAVAMVSGSSVEVVATPTPSAAPVGISGSDRGCGSPRSTPVSSVASTLTAASWSTPCPTAVSPARRGRRAGRRVLGQAVASASVARLDREGRVVAQVGLAGGSEPHGIALAPDGAVWVATEAGVLARLDDSR